MRQAALVLVGLVLGTPAAAQAPSSPPSAGQAGAPQQAGPAKPNPPTPNPAPPAPAAPASAATPSRATLDLVNNAKPGDTAPQGGVSPAVLRAEVMLDRANVSPGVIDGLGGRNFENALRLYEKIRHLRPSKGLTAKVWAALLAESPGAALMDYTLTDADVAGPFLPDIPKDYAKQAELKALSYRSPAQKIAAKFHMSERLLAALNPGVDVGKAGNRILVADIRAEPVHGKLASIVVDKRKGEVIALGAHGRVLAAFPATIGSRELPSPSGTYRVKGVAWNPIYYYNPKNFVQGDNHEKLKLPPGPNNPVGSVFIALSKPTYGLHGTPDPDKIDKTASHGCVRMTNWDATELAHLVHRGVVVHFKG